MRYLKFISALLLLSALLTGGCSGDRQHKKIGGGPLQIPSYEVQAPATGQIIGLIIENGERISKGQPLFAIGDQQLDAQVKELAAQTAKATAELKRLEQGATDTPPAENLAQAQADLTAAQQKAAKMNKLLAQGAVARRQAQAAQDELAQASARFQRASQAAVSSRPASPQAIAAQKSSLEQIKRQYEQAVAKQQANEASSPCTGVITQLLLGNNASVQKGQTILQITANESCQIDFTASAADAKALSTGQKVVLKAGKSVAFGGVISEINGERITITSDSKPTDLEANAMVDIYLEN